MQKVRDLLLGAGVLGALAVERHLVGTAQRGANVLISLGGVGNVVGLGKDGIRQLRQGLLEHVSRLGGANIDHGAVYGHAGVQHSLFQQLRRLALGVRGLFHLCLDNLLGRRLQFLGIDGLAVLANLSRILQVIEVVHVVGKHHQRNIGRLNGKLGIIGT